MAALFRVNPKTVTRWARAGKLTAIRTLGGHRRFRASEIRRCLEEMSREESSQPSHRSRERRLGARRRTSPQGYRARPGRPDPPMATPFASIRLRVRLDNRPGTLGRLATAIGEVGGNITAIGGFDVRGAHLDEDVIVNCSSEDHIVRVTEAVRGVDGVELLDVADRTFEMHEGGKIEVLARMPVADRDDLSMAYTPGVARVCTAIQQQPALVHELTIKKNTVAIVTDGTAVLGLGDIGPRRALPVMEGKALLFKNFAGVDAFPICLDVTTADEIVETVVRIAPVFGGINLEDIAAPACFEVEERLKELLDIPVFHDDQHGTAVVALAALENALRIVDKPMERPQGRHRRRGRRRRGHQPRSCMEAGVPNVIGVDRKGAIWEGRDDLNAAKHWFAENTNPERRTGTLSEVLPGADVFVGVSGPGLLTGRRPAQDGQGPDRVRHGQPRSGDPARRRPTAWPRSSPPAAATTRTRSTTCWPSPASSAAPSTWRHLDHRGHEAGRRPRHRRGGRRRRAARLHHPVGVRPSDVFVSVGSTAEPPATPNVGLRWPPEGRRHPHRDHLRRRHDPVDDPA